MSLSRITNGLARFLIIMFLAVVAFGENAAWTTETVDKSGRGVSIAVDRDGNLHVSYVLDTGDIKYAFRPSRSSRWFVMDVAHGVPYYGHGGGAFTRIVVSPDGDPRICYTSPVIYASYSAGKWHVEKVGVPGGGYACGIAMGLDGNPHLSWYQERDGTEDFYLHLKYAALKNGAWLLKTVDFDKATGKWNQLVLDSRGLPHISYSAYAEGQLKYAVFDGKQWNLTTVDSGGVGMGNALTLNSKGEAYIVYFRADELRFARQNGDKWSTEKIATVMPRGVSFDEYRSSIAVDSHDLPHISYEDGGAVVYAHYDGQKWVREVVSSSGAEQILFNTIAIGPDDSVYIVYRNPVDGSVTVATRQRTTQQISIEKGRNGTGQHEKARADASGGDLGSTAR